MKYEVGIAVHVTRRRTIEAPSPEAAVKQAMRAIAGYNNRNGIQVGDVLYCEKDGEPVRWNSDVVRDGWKAQGD